MPFNGGPTTMCAPGPMRWQVRHILKTLSPFSRSPAALAGTATTAIAVTIAANAVSGQYQCIDSSFALGSRGKRGTRRRWPRVKIGLSYPVLEAHPPKDDTLTAIRMPVPDPAIIARRGEIAAGLAAIVGDAHVIAAEDERRAYETDALTAYRAIPLAVVLPGSTEEVAEVLRYLGTA